jgi:hypothetical protein
MEGLTINTIKEIQDLFGSIVNIFATYDEDKGIHIADCSYIVHQNDFDEEQDFAKQDGRDLVFKLDDSYVLFISKGMEDVLTLPHVKVSIKRKTIYIDWKYCYDNRVE